MIDSEGIRALSILVWHDRHAASACERARSEVDEPHLEETLRRMRNEHELHARVLTDFIKRYGLSLPAQDEPTRTSTWQGGTTEEALRELRDVERMLLGRYRQALGTPLPPDVHERVRQFHEHGERSVRYLDETLDWRTWERPSAAQP